MTTYVCFLCKVSISKLKRVCLRNGTTRNTKTPLVSFIHSISGIMYDTQDFFICPTCLVSIDELDYVQMRSRQLKELLLNNLKNHEMQQPELTCDIRAGSFPTEADFSLHIGEKHAGHKDCNIEKVNSALEENVENPNAYEEFKCQHCDMSLDNNTELKQHILRLHKSTEQFVCELCGETYKQKTRFLVHMGTHNGVHPFTCIYCNKTFTQKIALQRHIPLHTGENPYQCDECGKRFTHHTSFNIHRLSHASRKPYQCNDCGLALLSSSHLKRHMRVHTGEKNFECSTCKRKFGEKYNLISHQKIHEREDEQCGIKGGSLKEQ